MRVQAKQINSIAALLCVLVVLTFLQSQFVCNKFKQQELRQQSVNTLRMAKLICPVKEMQSETAHYNSSTEIFLPSLNDITFHKSSWQWHFIVATQPALWSVSGLEVGIIMATSFPVKANTCMRPQLVWPSSNMPCHSDNLQRKSNPSDMRKNVKTHAAEWKKTIFFLSNKLYEALQCRWITVSDYQAAANII